jgi:hypothetical protein
MLVFVGLFFGKYGKTIMRFYFLENSFYIELYQRGLTNRKAGSNE